MVAIAGLPHTTTIEDDSIQVRFMADSTVAAARDIALVYVQTYHPKWQRLQGHREHHEVAGGSFRPFADRIIQVVEGLGIRNEQDLALHGFSKAADEAIEVTYQMLQNPNCGFRRIDRLGAWDPARAKNRGFFPVKHLAVVQAFATSGERLFENVLASDSPALLESRGINPEDPDAAKHEARVKSEVLRYTWADLRGALAITGGLGTAKSKEQLLSIGNSKTGPATAVGRTEYSTLCLPEFMRGLPVHFERYGTAGNDHSAADRLANSAGYLLLSTGSLGS